MMRDLLATKWVERLSRLALAAVVLTLIEVAVALALGHRYFLSLTEISRYALLAWANLSLWVMASGVLLSLAGDRIRRVRLWTIGVSVPLLSWLFWSLTAGRRVRDLPGRPLLVIGAVLIVAFSLGWAIERVRGKQPLPVFAAAVAVIAMVINAVVLRRLYPAFHSALSFVTIGAFAFAALSWAVDYRPGLLVRRIGAVALAGSMLATAALPWLTHSLSLAPNGRFAVSQAAPITGQWISVWSKTAVPTKPATTTSIQVADITGAGIDLHGQDILIITVDALRADRLRAYGGRGLTPQMDQLAAASVVFKRAYTPTPHTSYALSSMLTGKFMRPVLELPNASTDHRTLPEMLRRYGYRTAAFFPPAVFFVDVERFAALKRDDFGFEYRKVMFASAQDRVTQLEHYLSQAGAGHPVFAWVHLFEPHEPYAPAERFARGGSAIDRYDGEVAQADDGVGGLVRAFRASRPNSTVIVTADHGEEFDDHGGRFHGTTLFDEQVRVPLIWSSPGLKARTITAPVETIDLATTLLAALGVPRDARMRGDNLAVMLASDNESAGPRVAFADVGESSMATDGTRKLICEAAQSECVLFDLVTDPRETRDLSTQQPSVTAQLRNALVELALSIPVIEAVASTPDQPRDQRVRAALLLVANGDAAGVERLIEIARDVTLGESERLAAVRALGDLHAPAGVPVLIDLLADVRLRPIAATALGKIGGADSRKALLNALRQERYPAARQAEVDALILLKEVSVRKLIERFLGTDTSLPAGVMSLLQIGALSPPSARGARLIEANRFRGDGFVCDDEGCWPKRDGVAPNVLAPGTLHLPIGALRRPTRVTLAIRVTLPEARVRLGEAVVDVAPGPRQVSVAVSASTTEHTLSVAATEGVKLVALSLVPQTEDVPPPPPEPFVVSD